MIENLKNINDRNIKLAKFTEKDLNNLYLRVFSSADGELVLQDMANRFHISTPTNSLFEEGQRSAYLSIISRLLEAVSIKPETSSHGI